MCYFSLVFQLMVDILLGVTINRVFMSVVRGLISPRTSLNIVGFLLLLRQLPQYYHHLQLEVVVRFRTVNVVIRFYGVVPREAGD